MSKIQHCGLKYGRNGKKWKGIQQNIKEQKIGMATSCNHVAKYSP